MHTIIVDGKEISIRGKVEVSAGGVLTVPNDRSTRKLAQLLAPPAERGDNHHVVSLDGKPLPSSFLLSFRAPRRVISEG